MTKKTWALPTLVAVAVLCRCVGHACLTLGSRLSLTDSDLSYRIFSWQFVSFHFPARLFVGTMYICNLLIVAFTWTNLNCKCFLDVYVPRVQLHHGSDVFQLFVPFFFFLFFKGVLLEAFTAEGIVLNDCNHNS